MCNSTDEHPGCILNTEVNLGKCVWEPFHEMIVCLTICVCDSTNQKTKPPRLAVPTLTSTAKSIAILGNIFFPFCLSMIASPLVCKVRLFSKKKIRGKINGAASEWLLLVLSEAFERVYAALWYRSLIDLQQLGWWWAMRMLTRLSIKSASDTWATVKQVCPIHIITVTNCCYRRFSPTLIDSELTDSTRSLLSWISIKMSTQWLMSLWFPPRPAKLLFMTLIKKHNPAIN